MPLPSQAAHTLPAVRSPLGETATRGNASSPTNAHNQDSINPLDLTSSPAQQPQQGNAVPPARAGTKRKSTSNDDEDDVNLSDIDVGGMPLTDNPDQVRRKIHRLIENGGIKVGEFCDTIGVSNVQAVCLTVWSHERRTERCLHRSCGILHEEGNCWPQATDREQQEG